MRVHVGCALSVCVCVSLCSPRTRTVYWVGWRQCLCMSVCLSVALYAGCVRACALTNEANARAECVCVHFN